MKILLVGAAGTLGSAVAKELSVRHDLLFAGRRAEYPVDITDSASIRALFARTGKLDAIVSAAGGVPFVPLAEITEEQYGLGLRDKLMGQVNLAMTGRDALNDGGSITLTTGVLSQRYIVAGSAATLVNAALDGWVRAAAIELPRGLRINTVSPNVLVESMPAYGPFFRGFEAVTAARAALAFSRSVEGRETGQNYSVV